MITIICLYKHLTEIIISIFLLRLWIYYSINNYYNFFVKYIILLTNFILKYLKKFFFQKNKDEFLSFMIIILLIFLKYPILILIQDKNLFFYNLNTYLFVSILTLLKFLGYLFFWLITIYLISNIFNIRHNDFNDLLEIFINQIYNIKKNYFLNIYNINIILLITNIILYFLNNLLMDLFPQFWFLI
ncbi:hypothetical protein GJU04_01390 [Enterobacteriaceae endosymbiont of Donacia marginata]|uniref:hypothetical protein n=1 Tax=Enterobacteriaceae endosymbiont of Donacia marginata TaxID=2675779 RepID=UPI001448DBEA|nr:hypothetical protein [Enterobacteriaceae endosymbiont of Donacia marginata]QJC38198.1 hypothetical protein GJU04_01390 [Enterobacteriaceae endosymbiont of Donacia marginata]